MLYLVPTPIGNLEDITLRAIRILKEADQILAEDTRHSRKLLQHFDIDTPMNSFHAYNEHQKLAGVIDRLLEGRNICLITDGGTPGISDPGFLLVRECHEKEIPVSALPGPTAFVPALVMSGFPVQPFHFEGFLPPKKGRQNRWKYLATLEHTFVLYESPHKIGKCIKEMIEHLGEDRPVCLVREISKIHEEVIRATSGKLLQILNEREKIKGEIVLVVSGKKV